MGLLVDGKWRDVWYDTASTGGPFERKASTFRNWMTADGAPDPTGQGASRRNRDAITSTSAWRVLGRTGR